MTPFANAKSRFLIHTAIAAAMAGILLLGCGGRRSEQYRQQGDTYLHLNKHKEAEDAYRNATKADPKNVQASLGLGRCLVSAGKPEEALAVFQETTRTAPQNDLGYLEAADLFLGLGKPDEALAAAQRLEAVNAELGGVLRASVLLRAGQPAGALALLSELLGRFPDSVLVRTHLACVLLDTGEPGKAETELKAIQEKVQTESTGARMLLVEVLGAQARAGEIIDQQEKLTAKSPDQEMVLAHALVHAGRTEEGESLIRDTLKNNPNSAWASFAFGSSLVGKKQITDAVPFLRTASRALPWEAVVMRDLGMVEKPVPASLAASAAPSEDSALGKTQATTPPAAVSKEDWQSLWRQGALRRLIDERKHFQSQEGANLNETLTLAAMFLGDNALAEELAAGLPPDSPLNSYLRLLREKKPQEAVDSLKPWYNQTGDFPLLAMNAAGYAMAISGARGQAVQVLSACSGRYPDNGVSMLNLALVFRAANMPKFAARALSKLTAVFPENIEAHGLLFRVLRESGMQQEARQAAELMYALFPDSREASLAVCGIYMDVKELDQAGTVADQYLQAHPDDTEMLLTKTMVLLREGKAQDALQVLEKTPSSETFAPGISSMKALGNALLLNWQGVIDSAGKDFKESSPLTLRFILAAAHIRTGHKEEATAILTQTGKDEAVGGRPGAIMLQALGRPGGTLTDDETALAQALAPKDDMLAEFASGAAYQVALLHDDAYQAFKRVDDSLGKDNRFLLDSLFMSLANAARVKEVGAEAQALAGRHPAFPGAWLGCAALLQQLGDTTGERAMLDKAAEASPADAQVLLRRGNFFSRMKELDAAAAEYRRLLAVRPEDPVGNNNLAYHLLMTGGDPAEALKCAQLAAKGLPYDPHVLHTLGVALLRTGDLEQSKKNLAASLQLMPGDPSLLLDYGRLLIALGDAAGGRLHIENALANDRSLGLEFDRKAEAEEVLSKTPAPSPAPTPVSEAPTTPPGIQS